MKQIHLFDKSAVVERVTSMGSSIRMKLEPLSDGKVKVLEYYRKTKDSAQFKRVKSEEGQIVAFEKLGLKQSFTAIFDIQEAA
jgi:hypothetical protein